MKQICLMFLILLSINVHAFDYAFDFGPNTSPTSRNHYQVTPQDRLGQGNFFGWHNILSTNLEARDRGVLNSTERDFIFGRVGTFVINLPKGHYEVEVIMGDRAHDHDNILVTAQYKQRSTKEISLRKGEFRTIRFNRIRARNGQLAISFNGLNGQDPYFVVNAIYIYRVN